MNLATMQLANTMQQSMNTVNTTNASVNDQGVSFNERLNAATINDTNSVVPNQQKTLDDGNTSKKFQMNLGLGALLGNNQTKVETVDIDIKSLLNASNLKELGIDISDTELMTKQISLNQLAEVLEVDIDQLKKAFSELIAEEVTGDNLWDILAQLDMSAFKFIQNVTTSLEGKGPFTKEEISDVVKMLKFVELAAPKTDLTLQQEMQSSQVKNWMTTIASRVIETAQTQQDVKEMINKAPVNIKVAEVQAPTIGQKELSPNMKEQEIIGVVKPVVQQEISTTKSVTPELVGNAITKVTPQTTTITISLPQTTPTSQSENFVKQFEQIMNRSQLATNAQGQRLLIKLYPEHLGSIRIEFSQQNGIMSARILTSTATGKQMIESQLHQLKTGLVNQNIQLDRIDISQALSEPSRSEQRQQQFNQQSSMNQQNHSNQKENRQDDDGLTFEELLAELEV